MDHLAARPEQSAISCGFGISRRMLLQAVSALSVAPTLPSTALALVNSGDASSRQSRRLTIDKNYVLFPVNAEAAARRVVVSADGQVERSFTASIGLPAQWWAHLDVSAWAGQALIISIETDRAYAAGAPSGRGANETHNSELVAAVVTSSEVWSPETLYKEPLRPAFHFSSMRGWINDPNGLMYHAGEYHLFFQHNPYGVRSGNAHWGHAVSTDLVHWKELPIALYPRGVADFPYSGSGAIDHANTSGLGKDGRPPMIIAFTSTGRGECIAYSNDDGATWQEYEGNPVIKHDGRDPKLFWHRQTGQWVIVVHDERPSEAANAAKRHGFAFYTSTNLKSWRQRSWIEGMHESPDLFALPIDDDPKRVKWVLSCGAGYYYIGDFDGSRFIPESPRLPGPAGGTPNGKGMDQFPLLYAGQTFNNHPDNDRVQIAWGMVSTQNAPFTQLMSFPTKLSLRSTSDGIRLCREPVDAIRSLRLQTHDVPPGPLSSNPLLADINGEAWDIEVEFGIGTIAPVLMTIGGDEYVYHTASQMLNGPDGAMAVPLANGRLKLRLLVDKTTVEIFGDRGQAYGMFIRSNPGGFASLEFRTWKGAADGMRVEKLRAHSLRSAWSL